MNQLQSWYYRQPSAIRLILAINVVVYVMAQFLWLLWPASMQFIMDHFALQATFPEILLEPWQLITYNFMHTDTGLGGLLHIGFNMLWLFWIGREYEEMHGSGRMWTIYLFGGIMGGIVSLFLLPLGFFGNPNIPIVGASASVLGVLMAVAILYPYKQIGLLFFGVVRLIYIVVGFLAIDILINLGGSGVAVTAHWGGALGGFLFAKAERGGVDLTSWTNLFSGSDSSSRSTSRRSRPSTESGSPGFLSRLESWLGGGGAEDDEEASPRRSSNLRRVDADESSSQSVTSSREEEVDRILDKISEEGYDALSDEEKRILYEASQS